MQFRCLPSLLVVALLALTPLRSPAVEPIWPGTDWETATPESQGMSSSELAGLVSYAGLANVDSVLVTRNGRIVAEAYYAPYTKEMKHRINSATKAVTGALAGIAAGQRLLSAADPVLAQLGDTQGGPEREAVTLQHLLNMTSGMAWHEPLNDELPRDLVGMERSRNWVGYVLERPMAKPAGSEFNYNSGNSQLASAYIARKTGMSTRDFAERTLFGPIGIRDFRWRSDPQGVFNGGFGIYLHPRDMARFGLLYLNHGEWNGKQVVPRAWVDKVYSAQVAMQPMAHWRYADGWWTLPSRKALLAVGFQRQLIIVLPETGVVAALTGRAGYPFENVIDKLIAAVKSADALPADAQGEQLLGAAIAKASSPAPAPAQSQAVPAGPPARSFKFGNNPLRMRTLAFDFSGDGTYRLAFENERDVIARPLGFNGWSPAAPLRGETAFSRAVWAAPDKLMVAVRWPEEARSARFEFTFTSGRVDVVYAPMFGPPMRFSGESE